MHIYTRTHTLTQYTHTHLMAKFAKVSHRESALEAAVDLDKISHVLKTDVHTLKRALQQPYYMYTYEFTNTFIVIQRSNCKKHA